MKGAQINQLKTGEAIIVSPHFADSKSGFIPVHTKISPGQRYPKLLDWCESAWENHVLTKLRAGSAAGVESISERPLYILEYG